MTPSNRSTNHLKKQGFKTCVVEKYNSFAKFRSDMFGFGDIVAIHPALSGVLAINATTIPNISNHLKKYQDNESLKLWLQCGNRFVIHAWGLQGARGKRKVWVLKEITYKLDSSNNLVAI